MPTQAPAQRPTPAVAPVPVPATSAEQWFQKALEAHGTGDLALAEQAYRQALAVNPDHAHSLNNFAVLLKITGRVDEAIEVYRKAIDRAEDPIGVMNNMAIALLMRRRFNEALELMGRAIVLSPGYVETLFHFASGLREMANFDLAR
ncbi:MAG: tetratricopeptide repeat protein, partial [Alphaproteobacteria bacterium]|nr:tetratricopeptide repeat protein [Alphaproteobacteria bacterium]